MARSINAVIFILFVLAALLTVPVLIGVYVYRDASRRGMNAALWTLVAVAAPGLIGFIIYLLIRGNYPDLQCPRCAEPVSEQYAVCPHCGATLHPACPNCAFPVELGWKVCPKCATPLDGIEIHYTPPLRRRDRTLSKILIAIIAAPVALIVLAVFGLTVSQSMVGGSSTLREVTIDEYDQEQTSEEVLYAVSCWLASLEARSDRAYALRYDDSNELGAGHEYYYLFYIPDGGQSPSRSFGTDSGLFGTTLNLRLERTGYSGLYCVQTSVDRPPAPRVFLDGKRIRCDVTVVDYNPTLFFIEPNYARAEPGSAELPERLSVVKIVGNANVGAAEAAGPPDVVAASKNAGVVEIADKGLMLKILSAIDSGERVPMEQIPDYDFKDGFEIIVEYQIQEGLIMHPDTARHLVFMDDGICYLIDDRVTNTAHGSSFRWMDEDFYGLLEDLFQ